VRVMDIANECVFQLRRISAEDRREADHAPCEQSKSERICAAHS
jgi:hypothetical protein